MTISLVRWRVMLAALTGWAGTLTGFAVRFFLTPFTLHYIGETQFGLMALAGSIIAQGSLLDLGIGPAITRYVAEYHAQKDYDRARSLAATAFALYCVLGLVVIIAGAVIAWLSPYIFNVPASERMTSVEVIFLMALNLGLSIPAATPNSVLRGLHIYGIANGISVFTSLLGAAATVAALLTGGDVVAVVAVQIPVMLVSRAINAWYVRRYAPEMRFHWRDVKREFVKVLMSFSLALFAMDAAYSLHTKTSELVIGAFLPVSAVTPYAIARRLGMLAQSLVEPLQGAFLPAASHLNAQGSMDGIRSLYLVGSRVNLALFLPLSGTFIALAGPLLALWVGPQYAQYAPIVVIVTLANVAEFSHWTGGSVLLGLARHHTLAIAASCAAIASLVLSLLLVRPYGLIGVSFGTMLPAVGLSVGFMWPYMVRTIGVKWREVVKHVFLPTMLPLLPMMTALYAVQWFMPVKGLFPVGLTAAAGLTIYSVFFLAFGAGEAEREILKSILSKLPGRRSPSMT